MFDIRDTVKQMEMKHFSIPSDMKRDWCDLVKAVECSDVELESEHKKVLDMESFIADARRLYRNGIETGLRLLDKEGNNVTSLPEDIAISALIKPLLGAKIAFWSQY